MASVRRMATFLVICATQSLSMMGSGLTTFGLSVWVYQRTGSATQFALLNAAFFVAQAVVTLVGGVAADRRSRRQVMIISNVGASAVSIGLVAAIALGALQLWLVYAVTVLFGVLSALLYPSFIASIVLLVPRNQLGRANGIAQAATTAPQFVAPLAAALLLTVTGLLGLVVTDFATFLVAIATLAAVRIPQPGRPPGDRRHSVLHEAADGWRYIVARPGLLGLLAFFFVLNFANGAPRALLGPLVLRFGTAADLGFVSSTAGAAVLVGSLLMSAWGGPRRRIHAVLAGGIAMGAALLLLGARASVPVLVVAMLCYSFFQPVISVCNSAIWQAKVPPELQGRVLSTLRMCAWAAGPLALVVAGPLSDRVFEPLLLPHGHLAGSVGRLTGVGTGRGTGLLIMLSGLLPIAAGLLGYLSPAVRDVEDRLPDSVVRVERATA